MRDKPQIYGGLLDVVARRMRRLVFVVVVMTIPVYAIDVYLIWRTGTLTEENARLRSACGVQGR